MLPLSNQTTENDKDNIEIYDTHIKNKSTDNMFILFYNLISALISFDTLFAGRYVKGKRHVEVTKRGESLLRKSHHFMFVFLKSLATLSLFS